MAAASAEHWSYAGAAAPVALGIGDYWKTAAMAAGSAAPRDPDDIAGGVDKACVGEGATRKCASGLPVGVTGTIGDLVNIGAKAARIVHVLVLGEETL